MATGKDNQAPVDIIDSAFETNRGEVANAFIAPGPGKQIQKAGFTIINALEQALQSRGPQNVTEGTGRYETSLKKGSEMIDVGVRDSKTGTEDSFLYRKQPGIFGFLGGRRTTFSGDSGRWTAQVNSFVLFRKTRRAKRVS